MAAKKSAPAKAGKASPGKAMVAWKEELSRQAKISAEIESSVNTGGQYISTRGGQLKFNGADIPGNKMNVVILAHVIENALYTDRYDPDNPSTPSCFALGTDESEMGPHDKSTEPQADKCKGCPMNDFGSADTGRGKACKNTRRLALIPEDDLGDIESAEVAFIKVPPTSIKNWASFVKKAADTLDLPPIGLIAEISLTPDPKHQFHMNFKVVSEIDDGEVMSALLEKQKEVMTPLMAPYEPREEEPAPRRTGPSAARGARGAKPAAKAGKYRR